MTGPNPDRVYEPALRLRPWVWHSVYAGARTSIWARFRIRIVAAPDAPPTGPVLLALKHVCDSPGPSKLRVPECRQWVGGSAGTPFANY